jgi:hypothetical protein
LDSTGRKPHLSAGGHRGGAGHPIARVDPTKLGLRDGNGTDYLG